MRTRVDDRRYTVLCSNNIVEGLRYAGDAVMKPYTSTWNQVVGEKSSIEDSAHGFGRDNPCRHVKDVISLGSPQQCSYTKLGAQGGLVLQCTLEGVAGSVLHTSSQHVSAHIDALTENDSRYIPGDRIAEAFDAMYPDVKSKFNAIQSIVELKDFKRLPDLIHQTQRTIEGTLRSLIPDYSKGILAMPRAVRRNGKWIIVRPLTYRSSQKRWTLKEWIRSVTGATTGNFLNWQFAVAPLVRDIRAVSMALGSVRQQVDRLLKNEGAILSSHYTCSLDPTDVGVNEVTYSQAAQQLVTAGSFKLQTKIEDYVKYTCSMRYSYTYADHVREAAQELGKLDALGIQFNANTIWQLTPWTFVLDWFYNLGQTMERMRVRNLSPQLSIIGASHSVKYALVTEAIRNPWYIYLPNQDYVWVGCDPQVGLQRKTTVYVRDECTLTLFALPKLQKLTNFQLLLGGALAGSFWSSGGSYHGPQF